jgi:hypothetical protein
MMMWIQKDGDIDFAHAWRRDYVGMLSSQMTPSRIAEPRPTTWTTGPNPAVFSRVKRSDGAALLDDAQNSLHELRSRISD